MPVRVDSGFPGGNIVVDRIEGDDVFLHQDLRTTTIDWFYWYFRVRGAVGRRLNFIMSGRGWGPPPGGWRVLDVIGERGPAVSLDGGRTWRWLGKTGIGCFTWRFPKKAREARFSFGMPYVEADLDRFLAAHRGKRHLKVEALCRSRRGRRVELIRFGRLDGRAPMRVAFTCRHHSCEMMASYALEGVIERALADPWWGGNVEALAVPFMDKDGVEEGDQGKNRHPHDHNRDYRKRLYPEVRALATLLPAWSGGRMKVGLDLHCPYIRGPHNEVIYLVGSPMPRVWREQARFGRVLERVCRGPLPYRVRDNLPFGKGWNTGPEHAGYLTACRFMSLIPGVRFSSTAEIPYAVAGGCEVNQRTARLFGHDLARAVGTYLRRL